ncbi:hypothetical protein Tco_0171989, partial [Tanacetum coccineum]
MTSMCDMVGQLIQKKEEEKRIKEEQAAKDRYWKILICYDDDDDEESSIPLKENLLFLDFLQSDEVIKSSVEDLVSIPSELEGIPDKMCDVSFRDNSPPLDISKDQFEDFSYSSILTMILLRLMAILSLLPTSIMLRHHLPEVKDFHPEDGELEDDVLREKLSKINLLIAKIEALKDNPTPSSDFVTKSPSTSPNSFLEETNISYNSLPESETFCYLFRKEK